MNDSLYMTFISCLPRKRFGRVVGKLAGWDGSSYVSRQAVRWFADRYKINLDEAAEPIESYPNLRTFFIRKLKPGARPVDPDPAAVVSPVDGIIAEHGPIAGCTCVQVKGRTYSVDELLGGEEKGKPFHDGYFMTIYLSPRHYHRIHTPVGGKVTRYHHIPGHLFPVNPPSVRSVDRLFAINERLISYVRTDRPGNPEVAVVKVGAIGVGRIRVAYCDAVTNLAGQVEQDVRLDPPWPIQKGDELGMFELGSTVILIFPPGMIVPGTFSIGDEVKMGQRVATLAPGK